MNENESYSYLSLLPLPWIYNWLHPCLEINPRSLQLEINRKRSASLGVKTGVVPIYNIACIASQPMICMCVSIFTPDTLPPKGYPILEITYTH